MIFPLQDIVNAAVADKREKKEQVSWHPSKLGSCLRGAYLERMGVEPDEPLDDRTLRVFSVGKIFEDWFVEKLIQTGRGPEEDNKESEGYFHPSIQVRIENKEFGCTGYADLMVETKEGKKVYEIKTKHSRAFWYMSKEGKPMRQHEQQLWTYLESLEVEEGGLVYISKDDLTIAEFPVSRSNKELANEVKEQFSLLNKAWEAKDMKLLPLPEKGSWQQKYCRFHKQCVAK